MSWTIGCWCCCKAVSQCCLSCWLLSMTSQSVSHTHTLRAYRYRRRPSSHHASYSAHRELLHWVLSGCHAWHTDRRPSVTRLHLHVTDLRYRLYLVFSQNWAYFILQYLNFCWPILIIFTLTTRNDQCTYIWYKICHVTLTYALLQLITEYLSKSLTYKSYTVAVSEFTWCNWNERPSHECVLELLCAIDQ